MRPKMLKCSRNWPTCIDYQWGGMIGIGANRLPQIGRLASQPNVYYAQAYSGHGVNATHLAGRLLARPSAASTAGVSTCSPRCRTSPSPAASCCARRCWRWGCCGIGSKSLTGVALVAGKPATGPTLTSQHRISGPPERLNASPAPVPGQPDIAQLVSSAAARPCACASDAEQPQRLSPAVAQ
jgi:hypothetical protein